MCKFITCPMEMTQLLSAQAALQQTARLRRSWGNSEGSLFSLILSIKYFSLLLTFFVMSRHFQQSYLFASNIFCCNFLFCYEEAFPIDYYFHCKQSSASHFLVGHGCRHQPSNWFHLLGERGCFTTMALPPSSVFVGSVVSCYGHWGATGTQTNLPAGYPHPEELLKISASKLRLCGPRMELGHCIPIGP